MGRLLKQQKRGKGGPVYKSPSHKFKGEIRLPKGEQNGIVQDIIHSSGHSAPLAIIRIQNQTTVIPAVNNLHVGQEIKIGEPELGGVCKLKNIPEGTNICCVELRPEDGGKIIRSAGSSGYVVSKEGKDVVIRLPSGKLKKMNPKCRALIGIVAGGGMRDKPLLKAGKKYHKMKSKNKYWPIVSGVKKTPRDHPFGGGKHPGKPKTVSHDTPPGRKVGTIAPKKTGRNK